MSFPTNIKIRDLKNLPPFQETGKYIIYAPGIMGALLGNTRIDQVEKSGWNSKSVLRGLTRLEEAASKGSVLHRVYRPEDCIDDKKKTDVNVIFLPKTQDLGPKPFLIVCAGGAYSGVCSVIEGFPVAAWFNELGYDAFVFTYRVGGKDQLPKPIDDLAAAVKFILERKESFGISDEYVLCGFSAGANLISLFGTDNVGYKTYDLPKPAALIPVYTVINHMICGSNKVMTFALKNMYGSKPTEEKLKKYDVDEHMSTAYPPCYIVCGKNDSLVPPANSERLKECLDKLNIPAVLEEGDNAPHGFGDGEGTSVEGWIDRADAFIMSL